MGRADRILKHAKLDGRGIEVAPYFNPLVRKSDGRNVLILDVFDTETLKARAREDPDIADARINEIEDVDLVGDASRLDSIVEDLELAGQIDYIVSSHNFEHLPNPIRFLQGAQSALKPGGVLSIAVPDCRASFDHFRMPSRLADWLDAYHEDRNQPAPATVFDHQAHHARYYWGERSATGCDIAVDRPAGFRPAKTLREAYKNYSVRRAGNAPYQDAHCNVFFPEILELFIRDLEHLGLCDLQVLEITKPRGLEFHAHLQRPVTKQTISDDAFYARRDQLLRRISRSLGAAGYKTVAGDTFGERAAHQLRRWRLQFKRASRKVRGKV